VPLIYVHEKKTIASFSCLTLLKDIWHNPNNPVVIAPT